MPEAFSAVLDEYTTALKSAPLSDQTRRTYASKVRLFLAWLADTDTDGDPLGVAAARDWAVRDYRAYLQAVLKRKPATVNNALAAIDDLYIRRGLGPASATRAGSPRSSASTSTTSDGQPARACCASTAKARACARSRSIPSCARR